MKKILELTTVHPYPDTRIHLKYVKSFSRIFRTYSTGVSSKETRGLSKFIRIANYKSRLDRIVFGNLVAIKLIFKIRPHFCHIHDPELLPILIISKLLGINTIYDAHESLPEQIKQKSWLNLIPKIILEFGAKKILSIIEKFSDAIIAATPKIKEDFISGGNIFIVPNFPEINEYESLMKILKNKKNSKFNVTDDELVNICYVGSHLSEARGGEIILKISDELRRRGAIFKIHIAARIEEKDKSKYSNQNEIILYPRLSREKVFELMSLCDIGLLLEDYSPNHLDAYPIKLFEYASMGLNIITTDIPLWKNIVEDELKTGKAFNFNDWKSISEYIIELKKNEIHKRCEVSLACREKYSSDEYIQKVIEYLANCNSEDTAKSIDMKSVFIDWLSLMGRYIYSGLVIYFASIELFAEYSSISSVATFASTIITIAFARPLALTENAQELEKIKNLAKFAGLYILPVLFLAVYASSSDFIIIGLLIYICNIILEIKRYSYYSVNQTKFYEYYRNYNGLFSILGAIALYINFPILYILYASPLLTVFFPVILAEKKLKRKLNIDYKIELLNIIKLMSAVSYSLIEIKELLKKTGGVYFMYTVTHSAMYTLPVYILYKFGHLVNSTSFAYGIFISGAISQFSSGIIAHRFFNKRAYEIKNKINFKIKDNLYLIIFPIIVAIASIIAIKILYFFKDDIYKFIAFYALDYKIELMRSYICFLVLSMSLGAIQGLSYYSCKKYLMKVVKVEVASIILILINSFHYDGNQLGGIILLSSVLTSYLILKGQK